LVFGDGKERSKLEKQITESGLGNKFFLIGFNKDASRYMKAFDLLVLPSLSEGLALVLLEAKQAGIPIVASDIGGIPEALEDYQNYKLVPVGDSYRLFINIEKFLSQNNNHRKIQIKNYNDMYKKIAELYD
jgi:glycosyltransferase involved in cell wall biosynthesis